MTAARDRVVTTARRLFSERGYDGVSMRDLASDLGIQAPSIYSHFPSKADLLRWIVIPALDLFSDLVARAPTKEDADRIHAWFTAYERALIEHREAARLALLDLGAQADPPVGTAVLQIRQRARVDAQVRRA